MRKLIGTIASLLLCAAMSVMPVFAAEAKDTEQPSAKTTETVQSENNKTTLCFDTNSFIDKINTFGCTEESGFKYYISTKRSLHNGSLALSQNFADPLPDGNNNTGVYFSAKDFGRENFSGCTITCYVYAQAVGADELRLFSDGDVYITTNIPITASPAWRMITLEIPDDISNTMFGFIIKSTKGFNEAVCYVDNLTVLDENGYPIPNIGDYRKETDTASARVFGTFTVIVFVMLVFAVIAGCVLFIRRLKYRYR